MTFEKELNLRVENKMKTIYMLNDELMLVQHSGHPDRVFNILTSTFIFTIEMPIDYCDLI